MRKPLHALEIDDQQPLDDGRLLIGAIGDTLIATHDRVPGQVFGPPRSGKTFGVLQHMIVSSPTRCVAASVRTDLIDLTIAARAALGSVTVYDPDASLPSGYPSVGWNFVEGCEDADVAIERAVRMVNAGGAREGLLSADFWMGLAARTLATFLFAAGANDYGPDAVVRWVHTQDDFEVRALLHSAGNERIVHMFDGMMALEDRTRSSVFATLWQAIQVLDRSRVLAGAVRGGFSIGGFHDAPLATVYAAAPAHTQRLMRPLITTFVKQLIDAHFEREAAGEQPEPLLLAIDEAANIAPIEDLDVLTTTAAGTGVQLVTVWHDGSQIITTYGTTRAQTIVNNSPLRMFLPGLCDTASIELAIRLIGRDRFPGTDTTVAEGLATLPRGQALVCLSGYEATVVDTPATLFAARARRAPKRPPRSRGEDAA